MKKYNISKERVIRHYDANGKICPGFWCGSSAKDKLWKEQFLNKLESNSESKEESKVEKDDKPTIEYCVFAGGKWLPTVKGLSDFAGIAGEAISCLAIRVTKGKIKYRVHIKGGHWLSWVTGFNLNDDVNAMPVFSEWILMLYRFIIQLLLMLSPHTAATIRLHTEFLQLMKTITIGSTMTKKTVSRTAMQEQRARLLTVLSLL